MIENNFLATFYYIFWNNKFIWKPLTQDKILNIYAYTWYKDIFQLEVKQMKALGDWTPIFGINEMVKWFKALNFLRSEGLLSKVRISKMFISFIKEII